MSRFVSRGTLDVTSGTTVPNPNMAPSPVVEEKAEQQQEGVSEQKQRWGSATAPVAGEDGIGSVGKVEEHDHRHGYEHADEAGKKEEENKWAAVQRELEEQRRRREEEKKRAYRERAEGTGEASLFEVLQANKAAKQAAFDEANAIRNQFRALDDDEVDFLEGVREAKKREEEQLRKQTEEDLEAFRRAQRRTQQQQQQMQTQKDREESEWDAVGKKRKRLQQQGTTSGAAALGLGLLKKKKREEEEEGSGPVPTVLAPASAKTTQAAPTTTKPYTKPKAGLVDYGSDSDSE